MGIITGYTNQTITLRRADGTYDAYEQANYTTVVIPVRHEERMDRIINSEGREVMSTAKLFSEDVIAKEDKVVIDGVVYPILRAEVMYELDGTLSHYEAYIGRIRD